MSPHARPNRIRCRFNSGFFYKHPIMQQFDYYWRVEPWVFSFLLSSRCQARKALTDIVFRRSTEESNSSAILVSRMSFIGTCIGLR